MKQSGAINFFKNHLAQTTPFPIAIEVERASGIYIWDKSGKQFTDMVSGVAVSSLGHGQPRIIEAIKKQSEKYLHTMVYGEFVQDPQNALAKKLINHLPAPLDNVYFVNSGTEANEAALKLAKRFTGRTKLVGCRGGYHGSTHGSMSVSGNEKKKRAFRPLLPDVYFMQFNDIASLEVIDEKTAGVIVETIQGDAGVRIPSLEWIKALRKKCTETGAMLIFDEIQAGMGRTGKLFAFEHFDVAPDILTLGKALGGGLPIGAMISSSQAMKSFTHDPMLGHITTFGGHPLVCAAGEAAFDILTEPPLLSEIERKGKLLESLISHPDIREIRRIGLMFAVDFESEERVKAIFDQCLERGIITFWFLSHPASFRLAPPLTISEEEIRESAGIIREVIENTSR